MSAPNDYETDLRDVGDTKPPIAGKLQAWSSYRLDVQRWQQATGVPGNRRAPLIILRGLSRNHRLKAAADLCDQVALAGNNGLQHLVKHMDDTFRVQSVPTELARLKKLTTLGRKDNEKMQDYINRFRKQLAEVRRDTLHGGAFNHVMRLSLIHI